MKCLKNRIVASEKSDDEATASDARLAPAGRTQREEDFARLDADCRPVRAHVANKNIVLTVVESDD